MSYESFRGKQGKVGRKSEEVSIRSIGVKDMKLGFFPSFGGAKLGQVVVKETGVGC
jgi:hypothetical protein